MKKVFPTDEVAHIWARQSQDEGRNSASNVYFHGTKIYSYGGHFCMGNIIKPDNSIGGETGIVLFTTRTYSNTTAKHLSKARYAVNHFEIVGVPYPERTSEIEGINDNLLQWTVEIDNIFKVLNNTRKKEQTKIRARAELDCIVRNAARFFELVKFDVNKRMKLNSYEGTRKEFLIWFNAAKESRTITDVENDLKKLTKQLEKAATKKQVQSLADWLNISYNEAKKLPIDSVYLRVSISNFWNEKEKAYTDAPCVETSKGARVSLNAAKILFKMIQSGQDVKGYDIDGYTVISLNGKLKIGCHDIERDEINRFAKSQGWGILPASH